jgi:hypothetical protein
MPKLTHMMLIAVSAFALLAVTSVLTGVNVSEQRLATPPQVDPFELMSTAKDLPIQARDGY